MAPNSAHSDANSQQTTSSNESTSSQYPGYVIQVPEEKVLDVCYATWPDVPHDSFEIKYMGRGGYNIVYSISVPSAHAETNEQFILRVPMYPDEADVEQQVANIKFAAQQFPSLPVPEVLAFDVSESNALGHRYMIQQRLPGYPLNEIYDNLDHAQRVSVAKKWGEIVRTLGSKTYDTPGCLDPTPYLADSSIKMLMHDLQSRSEQKRLSETNPLPVAPLCQDVGSWVEQQCKRLRKSYHSVEELDELAKIGHEMKTYGMFHRGNADYVYLHCDLEMRNVLCHTLNDKTVELSVIDWDLACIGPRLAGCAPPEYLWRWENREFEDLPWKDVDTEGAGMTPADPLSAEIKQAYDDAIGPEYCWYTYHKWSRNIRRLFDICLTNIDQHKFRWVYEITGSWEGFKQRHDEEDADIEECDESDEELEEDSDCDSEGNGEEQAKNEVDEDEASKIALPIAATIDSSETVDVTTAGPVDAAPVKTSGDTAEQTDAIAPPEAADVSEPELVGRTGYRPIDPMLIIVHSEGLLRPKTTLISRLIFARSALKACLARGSRDSQSSRGGSDAEPLLTTGQALLEDMRKSRRARSRWWNL